MYIHNGRLWRVVQHSAEARRSDILSFLPARYHHQQQQQQQVGRALALTLAQRQWRVIYTKRQGRPEFRGMGYTLAAAHTSGGTEFVLRVRRVYIQG